MIAISLASEARIALQLLDEREHLLVLLDDLVALQLGQALQPHVEDGACAWISERSSCVIRAVARGVGAVGLRG